VEKDLDRSKFVFVASGGIYYKLNRAFHLEILSIVL
jgi:hypothetical protein